MTSVFKRCLKTKLAQGLSREKAGQVCRGEEPKFNPAPLPPKATESTARYQTEVDAASSVGPGWRSQGTNIGTDAVVAPDAIDLARAWAEDTLQNRSLTQKDRPAWETYATELGLDPIGVEKGWKFLSNRQESQAAEKTLAKIFGESVSWTGFWAPVPAPVTNPTTGDNPTAIPLPKPKTKKKAKKAEVSERISVNIMMPQAPEVGNARGQAQLGNEDPGFPFRTWSAKKVWEMAQNLILLYPLESPEEILRQAITKSGVLVTELTPEDDQLLKMAIDYLQNGPPQSNVRTGGTPGGPFRTNGAGGFLAPRGLVPVP